MYAKRDLEPFLIDYATKFPVVAVVGPRQAGKTTLAKIAFPSHKYFSLEDPEILERVRADPRSFLEKDYGAGVILDEFQNEPKILSFMQGIVDRNRRPGYFILTGSHNFLMNQAITQSLAGRVAVLTLLPLSLKELAQQQKLDGGLDSAMMYGGYPDLAINKSMQPAEFYLQYSKTYVERDVRQMVNVASLSDFQRFIRLCAGRIGQILNVSSLADDCGVSVPTIKSWLSILEASYIIFLLQPHFKNFSKRLIKSPKLYFYDTGLACFLLQIKSEEHLYEHYLRGGIFESLIIGEFFKQAHNQVQEPSVYFWRDHHGKEVDCLLDYGTKLIPVEIKSGATQSQRFFDGLEYWCNLAGVDRAQGYVVYGGDQEDEMSAGKLISWRMAANIVKELPA